MIIEEGSSKTDPPKQLSFTQDQFLYLTSILPKKYVLLPFTKTSKQSTPSLPRLKSVKKMEYEEEPTVTPKVRKEFEKSNSAIRKPRPKPTPIAKQEKVVLKKIKVTEELVAPQLRPCYRFLQTLKRHPSAWPFLEPVDPIALGIPTYFDKIKEPMDFGTIEVNLGSGQYETQTQFHADIGKVFMNSFRFNAKGSDVYQLTEEIEEFYNKLVENPDYPIPQKSKLTYPEPPKEYEVPKRPVFKRSPEIQIASRNPKKKKPTPQISSNAMTVAQKKLLGQNIRRLPRDSLKGVWEIVCSGNTTNQQLKFDIDKLSIDVARKLQKYVNSQFQTNLKGEFNVKESIQTTNTYKQKYQESQDPESFMVSEESN